MTTAQTITISFTLEEVEALLEWTDGFYSCMNPQHGTATERRKIKDLRDKLARAATMLNRAQQ